MSDATTADPEAPPIPGELWMLWHPGDIIEETAPGWAMAESDDDASFLVATSHVAAVRAAVHQAREHSYYCTPVRVK